MVGEQQQPAQGSEIGLGTPEMSPEELKAYLDNANAFSGDDLPDAVDPLLGDKPDDITDDFKPDEDDGDGAKPYEVGKYLKEVAERYEIPLDFNLLPKDATVEEELAAVQEIIDNRVAALELEAKTLKTYDKLIEADEETQMYLKARADGKTLKDLFQELGSRVAYSNEDQLVSVYIKDMYGFDDAQTAEEIEKMKAAGTYDTKKTAMVQAVQKREAAEIAAAEAAKQAEITANQQAWNAQVEEYGLYLKSTEKLENFNLSNTVKKDLFNFATQLTENGYTQLEQAVQSKENALKASIAIKYWDDFIKAIKSTDVQTLRGGLIEKMTVSDPSVLQSSHSSIARNNKLSDEVANSF